MSMLCCVAKIFYYFGLILYHACDIGWDWYISYSVLHTGNETTVGHFGDSTAPNSAADSTVGKLLLGSCFTGTFLRLSMVWVYVNYIKHHWN